MASTVKESYLESGVTIVSPTGKVTDNKQAFYRELALTTLKLQTESSEESSLYCFDAISETGEVLVIIHTQDLPSEMKAIEVIVEEGEIVQGLAGLQWKKHLGEKVTVTLGDNKRDDSIQTQCKGNAITVEPWKHVAYTERNKTSTQGTNQIYVSTLPTKAILHSEPFDFVYLHTHGSQGLFMYIESVVSTIKSGGVACLLCPNIASQCFRSPKLVKRQYHAHTQKTVYVTEMAARIVIGDIVRTAARHGRVAEVLCTLSAEGLFLFIIRMKANSKMAGEVVDKCRPVLHCLMCEERVVYPETHCPIEKPYSLLPCDCNSQNPGKTATIFGPMWVGPIYDVPFMEKLAERLKSEFPKSAGNALLSTVITEAICDNKWIPNPTTILKSSVNNTCNEPPQKRQKLENQSDDTEDLTENKSTQSARLDHKNDKIDNQSVNVGDSLENNTNSAKNMMENSENQLEVTEYMIKDNEGSGQNVLNSSKADMTEEDVDHKHEDMPLFYYHLHQLRCSVVPRSDVVVTRLKKSGYRASRTHFETYSIRTNATQKQLQAIIQEINKSR